MHRVPRLERDYPAPAMRHELLPHCGRRGPVLDEIVMFRKLEGFNPASEIERVSGRQSGDAGVLGTRRPVHGRRFRRLIRLPYVLHVQDRQQAAFGITKRETLRRTGLLSDLPRDIQHDRQRPQRAVG
jgi:hypothetical protein